MTNSHEPDIGLTPELLEQIAGDLDAAQRHGAEQDQPEGTRYAILSDTLLARLAHDLRQCAMAWRAAENRSVVMSTEVSGTPPAALDEDEFNWREGGQG